MKNRKPIYLAGPFFNPAQLGLMTSIEAILDCAEVPYFSPRLHTKAPVGEERKELGAWDAVLEANIGAIEEASILLAILDYALPNNQTVTVNVHTSDYEENHGEPVVIRKPVVIPDTGTVWELGFAFATGIPAVGFFQQKPERMNLMLTNTLDALLIGLPAVYNFVRPPAKGRWVSLLNRLAPQMADWSWEATTSMESFLAEGGSVI